MVDGATPRSRAIWRFAIPPTAFMKTSSGKSGRLSQYVAEKVWLLKERLQTRHVNRGISCGARKRRK
jgi:hypothetical protein